MNKLIFLFVAVLAFIASANAQTAAASVSLSSSITGSGSMSVTSSLTGSPSITASASNSVSSSTSLSKTVSPSVTASVSISMSTTSSPTASASMTQSGTGTVSSSLTNTISGTQTVTQTGSVSSSFSSSVSGPMTMSPSVSGAPPPSSVFQVTTGCGAGRKQICVGWTRPSGVPATNYVVTVTGVVSGQKWVYNFTHGETFVMVPNLQPGTAYAVTVQTIYGGTISQPASLTITTAAAGPKQNPALGITGFSCHGSQLSGTPKRQRAITCTWTAGATPYTNIHLRIKCTETAGSIHPGKHRKVRRMLKAGLTTWVEKGFQAPSHCKVIANPSYSTGPGRRIVQVINIA